MLIVYHSQSGACAELARALWRGAGDCIDGAGEEATLSVQVLRAWDCDIAQLSHIQGLILVAAENAGYISGGMKNLIDRIFYPAIDRALVLPYALVISAGNDGRNACRQVQKILSGIPFREAQPPLICRGEITGDHRQRCRELGQGFATGVTMGLF
ncbi:MAG: flavodoxin [Parahaliea sp.]